METVNEEHVQVGLDSQLDLGAEETAVERKRRQKSQWCSAINCSNDRCRRPDLSFFRFPKDEERCRKWVVNTRRQDLLGKTVEALNMGNVLCSDHFENSQFTNEKKNQLKRKTAVPTLFSVPNPPDTLQGKRAPPKQRQILKPPVVQGKKVCQPSTSSQLCENVPRVDMETIVKLKKKVKSQKVSIKRLQNPKTMSSKLNKKKEIEFVKSISGKYLPPESHYFFSRQLDLSLMKGKRWAYKDKSQALSLYHTSPRAYSLLQKQFALPSISTLRRTMQNLHIYPGFPDVILKTFELKIASMTERDKHCILILDEMALKKHLSYNVENDYVEGLEDFGDFGGRSDKAAEHAMVFMVRGLFAKWKQPIGYFLSQSAMRHQILERLLFEALTILKSIGLKITGVLSDQGSNNCAVFRKLQVTEERPFFYHDGEEVLVFFYPPHLLKNIRNNLIKKNFITDDGVVSWKVIRDFYDKDKTFPLRMAPKLTIKHIILPAFAHLRVSLASQVLSHSVAAGIAFLCQVHVFPDTHMATSRFIEKFDNLFNVFNITGGKSSAPFKHIITATSSHVKFLQDTAEWLKRINLEDKPTQSLPCIRGWIQTINALLMLINKMLKSPDINYLITNRLNQDCLENLFAVIRSKGGHQDNPDPYEFRIALRQVMVDKVLMTSKGTNCEDDLDVFLLNFSSTSTGSNSSVFYSSSTQTQNKDTSSITNLVNSVNMAEALQLENVIAYISGYIALKVSNFVCDECKTHLKASSQDTTQFPFLQNKQYTGATDGLRKPSHVLIKSVALFESMSHDYFQKHLKNNSVKHSLTTLLLDLQSSKELKSPSCNCKTVELIVNLFVTIRIHHELKLRNEELNLCRSKQPRKNRKLEKLQHQ